jgi:hypothetical protein
MLMYFMMFLAAIRLRLREPQRLSAFRIPGGITGLLCVSLIGMVGVLATLVVSFLPPEGINVGRVAYYELTLIVSLLLMCSPPLISSWFSARKACQRASAMSCGSDVS